MVVESVVPAGELFVWSAHLAELKCDSEEPADAADIVWLGEGQVWNVLGWVLEDTADKSDADKICNVKVGK